MPRYLLFVPVVLSLAGCQMPATVRPENHAANGPACYVEDRGLAVLLRQQQQYLSAESDSARQKQLTLARRTGNKALEALLLASPGSSPEQLSKGADLLESLPLYPGDRCLADRYLDLQLHAARHSLKLQSQLSDRDAQIVELKRKIEALTDLEQQITRQRKDL